MKIITVSGASGSGKSLLTNHIQNAIEGSLLLSIDRYYLSKTEQIKKNGYFNFDDPASIDSELLRIHLDELTVKGRATVPIYDFTVSERDGYEAVMATNAIIVDGLFSNALLENESHLSIFVDVDLDVALERRIKRDVAERGRTVQSVIKQYEKQVRPSYEKFIAPLRETADHTLTNNHSIDEFLRHADELLTNHLPE